MKKLLVILMICSMLFLATSCQVYDFIQQLPSGDMEPTVNPDGTINYVEMSAEDYDQLNALIEEVSKNVTVTVTSTNSGAVLNAVYVITNDRVEYTVDQLAMLPEDADINKLPESMIETYSGVVLKNGNGDLVDENNVPVALPESDIVSGEFNFSESNFRNGKRSPYGFEGDVISVSALFGIKMSVDSMHVKVDYSDAGITRIAIDYVKDGASVTVTYEFS